MSGGFAINNILLVAGGTGGHILPAVAFGDWVRREKPKVHVSYISGSRQVELEIYRASNIEPFILDASGSPIGVSGFRSLKRWIELFSSFFQTSRLLRKLKPDICLLFGGYVSIPALFAGRMRGIRSILHEQNALAGRVTKIAAKTGIPVASGWKKCEPLGNGKFTNVGVPIRRLRNIGKDEAWKLIGAAGDVWRGPVVSAMTGSLGSEKMLETIVALSKLDRFSSWKFFVVDPKTEMPSNLGGNIAKLPRMWDISPLYSVSDLLLTRGGASTLAEVLAMGKPAAILPWRDASGDHQMKNALSAEASGKIFIWDEKSDSLSDLADKLQNLYSKYTGKNGDMANMLYNAGEASETNCRRLWNFVADCGEGNKIGG